MKQTIVEIDVRITPRRIEGAFEEARTLSDEPCRCRKPKGAFEFKRGAPLCRPCKARKLLNELYAFVR